MGLPVASWGHARLCLQQGSLHLLQGYLSHVHVQPALCVQKGGKLYEAEKAKTTRKKYRNV